MLGIFVRDFDLLEVLEVLEILSKFDARGVKFAVFALRYGINACERLLKYTPDHTNKDALTKEIAELNLCDIITSNMSGIVHWDRTRKITQYRVAVKIAFGVEHS